MKSRLVLPYMDDRNFDQVLREALFGTDAIVLNARSVGDALHVLSSRGRELDFAILDFNSGCRGMTLLGAIHSCYQRLPTLVFISKDSEHAGAVAYANGARACLTKPIHSGRLANSLLEVVAADQQLVAS